MLILLSAYLYKKFNLRVHVDKLVVMIKRPFFGYKLQPVAIETMLQVTRVK